MKILFYGSMDPANTSNRVCRAIRSAGGDAWCFTNRPHPFIYDEDATGDLVRGWSGDVYVSSGMADYDNFWGNLPGGARYAIRHGGPYLRTHPDCPDEGFFRRFVPMDLWRLVKDDPRARVFVQPQDRIIDELPELPELIRICHTPSHRGTKGTNHVYQAMIKVREPHSYNLWERMTFDEVYRKRNTCHIYIDSMDPRMGNFGAAACEAMANGLAVVGDIRHVEPNPYIPPPPIVDVRDRYELAATLNKLVLDRELLNGLRMQSLAWAKEYLSPGFTRAYWEEHLS